MITNTSRPDGKPGVPPHIAAGLKEPVQKCDCDAVATQIGWFESITGANYPIHNGVFLCDACAAQLKADDPAVTFEALRKEPAWAVLP